MQLRGILRTVLYAVVFGIASGAHAQTAAPPPLNLTVSPTYPAPYSTATLSLTSGTLDLANATVTVSSGGTQIYKGNAAPIAIPVGALGKPVQLLVTVSAGASQYRQALTITPEDVSLVAEPLSTAPPLYPGKPLVASGGSVRVVAESTFRTAGGALLPADSLSYAWTVDGTALASASGIGKDVIIVPAPLPYRSRSISVTVQSADGLLSSGGTLALSANAPTLRLYESDPLKGILFDHALSGTFAITGAEAALYAAAYSFPLESAPSITWFLNGSTAQTGPTLTVRPTGTGSGSARLSASATSGDTSASGALTLTFGTNTTSLFGL